MKETSLQKAEKIREISRQYALGNGSVIREKPTHLTISFLARKLKHDKAHRFGVKHARLADMGISYTEYIQSPHWKEFRAAYIEKHGTQCEIDGCHRTGKILHHHVYDRLGFELEADVALVCPRCHDRIHAILRR